jgi:hypothetical protein
MWEWGQKRRAWKCCWVEGEDEKGRREKIIQSYTPVRWAIMTRIYRYRNAYSSRPINTGQW